MKKKRVVPHFGDKIIAMRKKYHISQQELSTRLGVSFVTVNRWENGHCTPHKWMEKAIMELEQSLASVLAEQMSGSEIPNGKENVVQP